MNWLKQIYYGLLAACLVALFFNHKKLGKENYFFYPILIFAIITQVTGDIISVDKGKEHLLFHIYIPVELMLLSFYYYYILEGKTIKLLTASAGIMFLLYSAFYYTINVEALFREDFYQFVVEAVLVSVLVIIFFRQLFKKEEQINLNTYPAFWINTGNLLFYAGCSFVMGLYNYLHQKDIKEISQLLYINYILNLILYILYFIAFTCRRTSKS